VLELVDDLFPFHLSFNSDLILIKAGKSIQRMIGQAEGHPLSDFVQLKRPFLDLTFSNLKKRERSPFIFMIKDSGLLLRGHVKIYEQYQVGVFVATPVVSNVDVFLEYDISLADFKVFDVLPDFLLTKSAQETSYREIQELNSQLKASQNALIASNQELEQFAFIASHDLQSPLRNIISFSQLLKKRADSSLDQVSKEYLNFIIEGTQRMQNLVEDLLAYSQVQQSEYKISTIDFNELAFELIQELNFEMKQSNANIEFSHIPAIQAHRSSIKQLFQNLLNNALKFQQSGMQPRIAIKLEEQDNYWLFKISDNGIGMDMNDIDRIFEIFRRAVRQEDYTGTGIGLAICKKTVERHGGQIWVESELGEGSTFFFTINKHLSQAN